MLSYLLSTQTLISSLGPRTTTSIFFLQLKTYLLYEFEIDLPVLSTSLFIYYVTSVKIDGQLKYLSYHMYRLYIQSIPLYFSQLHNKVYSNVYTIYNSIYIANMHILFLNIVLINTIVLILMFKMRTYIKRTLCS